MYFFETEETFITLVILFSIKNYSVLKTQSDDECIKHLKYITDRALRLSSCVWAYFSLLFRMLKTRSKRGKRLFHFLTLYLYTNNCKNDVATVEDVLCTICPACLQFG